MEDLSDKGRERKGDVGRTTADVNPANRRQSVVSHSPFLSIPGKKDKGTVNRWLVHDSKTTRLTVNSLYPYPSSLSLRIGNGFESWLANGHFPIRGMNRFGNDLEFIPLFISPLGFVWGLASSQLDNPTNPIHYSFLSPIRHFPILNCLMAFGKWNEDGKKWKRKGRNPGFILGPAVNSSYESSQNKSQVSHSHSSFLSIFISLLFFVFRPRRRNWIWG